jgi:hypothetical protein
VTENESKPTGKPTREDLRGLRAMLEEVARQEEPAPVRAAPDPVRRPAAPRPPVIRLPDRLPEDDPWTVQRKPAAAPADTETLLNGLIDECGFLMREVALRMMLGSNTMEGQIAFMDRAMQLAETGAKVGDTVGRLRGGQPASETRQRVIVERVERREGEGEGVPSILANQ